MLIFFSKVLEEFAAFLHNGQVSCESRIKDVIEADLLQCSHQLAQRAFLSVKSDAFTPGSTHSRCDLNHSDLFRICKRIQKLHRIISFTQRSHRAVGDALSAEGTVGLTDRNVLADTDRCPVSCSCQAPYVKSLNVVTDLDTAHAFDTLGCVPDQRLLFVPFLFFRYIGVRHL